MNQPSIKFRLLVVCVLMCLIAPASAEEPLLVKYLGNNTSLVSEDYYLALINAALKVTEPTHGAYRFVFTQESLNSERKHELLVDGEKINVDRLVGFPNQKGAREGLLRVPVPLLNGLMGYRILLIRSEDQPRFSKVKTLKQLTDFSMGFGRGWEGHVYRHNGFTVAEPPTMESLLKMLAGKRYSFVPLSVIEIDDHYTIDGAEVDNLVPEQSLLIYMPMPVYFYVSPAYPMLAERLSLGLEQLAANGQQRVIFDAHFGARLDRLNLSKRKLIELTNPDDDGSLGKPDHTRLRAYSKRP